MHNRRELAPASVLLLLAALTFGCGPAAVQYPPGSYPASNNSSNTSAQQTGGNPSTSPAPQPPARSGRGTQHVMESMAQGAQWGGLLAGPFGHFGVIGGAFVGAIWGIVTIGAEEERVAAQVNKETQKDQQLEALIEQELERQRALEGQIINASASGPGAQTATPPTSQGNSSAAPAAVSQPSRPRENIAVASVNKPVIAPTPSSPFKNVEVRDINGDGIPDLWIYYNPQNPREIVRQEESTKGDGRVDTWSYFKDGKLLRREVDTQGQGRPTTVFYYNDDRIVREERDEGGQGIMTYRGTYENGRVAKVERDTAGRGRPDLWVYYDTSQDGQIVVKEERDINGDGIADIWTYFENGRMVRRDVSATGLEVLSKQEQVQAPVAEFRPVSLPGS